MKSLKILQKTEQLHEAVGGSLSPATVHCYLCPRTATSIPVKRDSASFESIRRELYSLGYGAPAALQVDPIREETAESFLPGRVSLVWARRAATWAGFFCQNWDISNHGRISAFDSTFRRKMCRFWLKYELRVHRVPYNEPTIWANTLSTSAKRPGNMA